MRKYRFNTDVDNTMLMQATRHNKDLWVVKLMSPKWKVYTFYIEEVRHNVFRAAAELELSNQALSDIRDMFQKRGLSVIEERLS